MRILALLFSICAFTPPSADGATNDARQIKESIVTIDKEVVDYTESTVLLRNDQFLSVRKSLSDENAKSIVELIQKRALTLGQSFVGIGLLSGLPEERYWKIAAPLLSTETNYMILSDILMSALPYGPGFANSIKDKTYRDLLGRLKQESKDEKIKNILDLILSGKASKAYQRFTRNPEAFRFDSTSIANGRKSRAAEE
jgi:hypothetical protein